MTLAQKTILITGSSRGLGRDIALALGKLGGQIVVNYRQNAQQAHEVLSQLNGDGVESMAICADVKKWQDVKRLTTSIIEKYGKIDVLINNVGDFIPSELSSCSIPNWHEMLNSNLSSAFYCCKAAIPFMKNRNYGRIINIGLAGAQSIHAYKNVAAYAIAKSGVLILSKSLALELAPHGITVNTISPGLMNNGTLTADIISNQEKNIPMKKVGSSQDMLGAILFLLSDQASYISGADIVISGAWGI